MPKKVTRWSSWARGMSRNFPMRSRSDSRGRHEYDQTPPDCADPGIYFSDLADGLGGLCRQLISHHGLAFRSQEVLRVRTQAYGREPTAGQGRIRSRHECVQSQFAGYTRARRTIAVGAARDVRVSAPRDDRDE